MPIKPASGRRAIPLAPTALCLLRHLVRRGARASLIDTAGCDTIVQISVPGGPDRVLCAVAKASVWLAAVSAGWVDGHGGDGHWRISRAGRTALKKARSAGPEGIQRVTTADIPAEGTSPTPGCNPAESPIAWLRRRKDRDGRPLITAAQFDAGERLRADFWFAQMSPRITVNWSGSGLHGSASRGSPGFGVDMSDNVAAAKERVRRALTAVGPELAGMLIDVCGHLKGLEAAERNAKLPLRSGKVVLGIALNSLARHYGIRNDDGSATRATVRHWGADDYRPRVDGDD